MFLEQKEFDVPARERFLGTFGGASLVYSNIATAIYGGEYR